MNAVNRHNEASFKKQQAHFVGITQRYRMLCDKLGISPTVLFNRVEELDQLLARKGSKSHRNNENADYEEVIWLNVYNLICKGQFKSNS